VEPLIVTADCIVPPSDLAWTAVRASGPGGQNVNKVSSRVELRFDLENTSALTDAQKARARVALKNRLDAEGRVVLSSQATRDQHRNLEDARRRLADLLRPCLSAPRRRRPTRPSRGAVARRLDDKRRQGDKKAGRRAAAD
jgi:ribosome-associated protein